MVDGGEGGTWRVIKPLGLGFWGTRGGCAPTGAPNSQPLWSREGRRWHHWLGPRRVRQHGAMWMGVGTDTADHEHGAHPHVHGQRPRYGRLAGKILPRRPALLLHKSRDREEGDDKADPPVSSSGRQRQRLVMTRDMAWVASWAGSATRGRELGHGARPVLARRA